MIVRARRAFIHIKRTKIRLERASSMTDKPVSICFPWLEELINAYAPSGKTSNDAHTRQYLRTDVQDSHMASSCTARASTRLELRLSVDLINVCRVCNLEGPVSSTDRENFAQRALRVQAPRMEAWVSLTAPVNIESASVQKTDTTVM